ncbi:molybdopterin synthase sulfur carrier subunit [Sphingobacterium mizutaii NBRC 14946 = DSM 11724]|uniref:Molybdopterin synthase sulfur carrier subunit n=2 Tax=Sphingobacterium mizutaii TaxID=1010 RepID=A0AAJ4XAE0_9SPHI|nr:MoaD/ThiS family protein [Sphingobacterium mizutaii]GEM69969.1 molybdopterin synthase sulfur carrier subunit [Sphingobacterium mizutaii NBRC 14946 = DSM 11724]SDK91706.1 molybdopterin synthase sulfur carrier subunit [Sphingobacterium mizutaii]SNV47864.1 Sulfur carrier protein moaD [Sphingobacterium mizutaii]
MKITVLGFGIAKDIFGSSEIHLEVNEGLNVSDLRSVLEEGYPQLNKLKSYMLAIDEEYAEDSQIINSGNEIAVIPPVSGG